MNKAILILFLAIFLSGCSKEKERSTPAESKEEITEKKEVMKPDTTPKVTGVGGIFFQASSPGATKEWYAKNLGLVVNEYGSTFETRNANRQDEINYLQWSAFKKGTDYMKPSKKEFMINYRVQNLEGLVRNMRADGVTILDTIEVYEYGKFVHIMDNDGNKIELWEPIDSVLTKLDGATTK
jgi:predicted enzyme related to lactoylglutathione lyase